jgi:hypothetical protein
MKQSYLYTPHTLLLIDYTPGLSGYRWIGVSVLDNAEIALELTWLVEPNALR